MEQSFRNSSGLMSGGASFEDAFKFAAAFPDRWRLFLHAHFPDARHAAWFFGVSERAAAKWWDGVGSAGGAKVAYALARFPETAPPFLVAA